MMRTEVVITIVAMAVATSVWNRSGLKFRW
jgi:hypothetical protein